MPLTTEWTGKIQSVMFGTGTVYRIDESNVVGVGVPAPKTNDVDLAHGNGAYANTDRKAARVITIPFVVLDASPSATMDSFETLAAAWEPVSADVTLELYLPGKHFLVAGRPRGLVDDLRHLKASRIDCIGTFVALDPTMAAQAARTVSNKALTSNVATLTTSTAHGFTTGREVVVAGVDATFNGTYTIASVPTSTTFTYAKTAADVASTAASGTATSWV